MFNRNGSPFPNKDRRRDAPGSRPPDMYQNLDGHYPIKCFGHVKLRIDDVAKEVVSVNYGTHRMLSALIRELRTKHGDDDGLARELQRLLDNGYY